MDWQLAISSLVWVVGTGLALFALVMTLATIDEHYPSLLPSVLAIAVVLAMLVGTVAIVYGFRQDYRKRHPIPVEASEVQK